MTVRPEVLIETLILSVVLSVWDGHLELGVEIQDQNNHFHSAYALLEPLRSRVVSGVAEAVVVVRTGLPEWVDSLVPLLDRERAYQALPFPPDGRFRSSSVAWFDKPNALLAGRTPAEAIVAGELPQVVEAARSEGR